ncbi:hypothetical protein EJ08DRAFT_587582 [Tothia fuscella]|uniref:Uncharacterized protein n=1 Tax=Tothia fuscella TaxID=1048955 RepID=A0A9P4NT72_9PEZI|nr:hypothetical protein EJ08DRAFT_587582 [Tothia fuscella]
MASPSSAPPSTGSGSDGKPMDPYVRNAMRYSLSPREYKLLHEYLISRTPVVQKKAPPPGRYEAAVKSTDDYNAAAVRAALRVYGGVYTGLRLWELVVKYVLARGVKLPPKPKVSLWKNTNVRLSSSLSLLLLFHRLLHRFFLRLRESLLDDNAQPFRQRNPRVAKTLTSKLAPAVGASLAGFWLGLYPASQLRITIAIYLFSRSLEFGYNRLEDEGYFKNRPWWFGSWLLMPAACGQLLHAFVFDRECFPSTYGNFILRHSSTYIQSKPEDFPTSSPWPSTFGIVDNLADISRLSWPPFVSPIMFPTTQTLPAALAAINPITSSAHPAIKNLSCALLHPNDPSCLRTYISFFPRAFPTVAKFFAILYGAFSLLSIKAIFRHPIPAFNKLSKSILRMTLFVTGAIGTSWGSICLMQHLLPRHVLPTQRFVVGGALGGMWAFLERKGGRSNFLYSTRLSIDSFWKVGVKHGWWRGVSNGDVLLFVASLALVQGIYEVDPKAVTGGMIRKTLGMLRGEGWVDRVELEGKVDKKLAEREIKDQSLPIEGQGEGEEAVFVEKKEL